MEASIYRDLDPETALACGYFEPKESFNPLAHDPALRASLLDKHDRVIYYPGSFGTFHEGHIAVCTAAMKKYPDAYLVIAPANSDYTSEKYGVWSERASNKHRYDAIKYKLRQHNINAIIDIDPMLNHRCDQNFTDQLNAFLKNCTGISSIEDMSNPPVILCGKDRYDFLNLNNYTKSVVVEHIPDTTGCSTSNSPNKFRHKKRLILRCKNQSELELFQIYFKDQYEEIKPLFLNRELEIARMRVFQAAMLGHGYTHTICKEYRDLLPYIKLSRHFRNPLEDGIHNQYDITLNPEMKILDSDIFSGTTRDFILSFGCEFDALLDFSGALDRCELLDFEDFRDPMFRYPFVDISSRCSMQAFDFDFHKHYDNFHKEAIEL